jgi:RIO-like serine/threonine protein kinase
MNEITFKQAKEVHDRLSDNLWGDEENHYCEVYDVDAPENIPTESLKNHAYRDLRVLDDYFNSEQNYHEKVKDILWEYISKNDEEEIFKRIEEVK